MPDTDMSNVQVVSAKDGWIKATKTWVLGRLLRDLNHHFNEELVRERDKTRGEWVALRVYIYEIESGEKHEVPNRDWVWYSGLVTIIAQLGISIVPWILSSHWGAFLVTLSGNFLALVEASLPPWKDEKWATQKSGNTTVTLTQGNGSRHAVVILTKKGDGLNLEILAQGNYIRHGSLMIRVITAVVAVLWIVLLVTVSGFKLGTWCKSSN
jgi:hypothetical protein